jgi:hypothetical protein
MMARAREYMKYYTFNTSELGVLFGIYKPKYIFEKSLSIDEVKKLFSKAIDNSEKRIEFNNLESMLPFFEAFSYFSRYVDKIKASLENEELKKFNKIWENVEIIQECRICMDINNIPKWMCSGCKSTICGKCLDDYKNSNHDTCPTCGVVKIV